MRRLSAFVVSTLGAVSLMVAGAGALASAHAQAHRQGGGDVGWTMVDGNLSGWRYSPLTQINTSNVKDLKVAWKFPTGVAGAIEDTPLVIGNVAYVDTAFNHIFALNATTGQELWSYVPTERPSVACCGPVSRGLAYHDGTVYALTLDNQLLSINAKTGKLNWKVYVASTSKGYAETAAPLYYDGMIFIGSSGSELGVRGFEEARSAATGKLIWQFYTVPPKNESWVKSNGGVAGGTVWSSPVIDPKTGMLFIATGNPAPLLYGQNRPGPDHWTDSEVALNVKTGKFIWGFSTVPHDMWDYDNSSNPILFPTTIGMGVGEAGKSGMWWEFLAQNGEMITEPQPFLVLDHTYNPPTKGKPVLISPAPNGGDDWSPPAFSPKTGYVYIEGTQSWAKLSSGPKGTFKFGKLTFYFGSNFYPVSTPDTGTITAFVTGNGTWAWHVKVPGASEGGPTVTASNIVFASDTMDGVVYALNATTGAVLAKFHPGGGVASGIVPYMVNGKEYILLATGGAGQFVPRGKLAKAPTEFIAYTLP